MSLWRTQFQTMLQALAVTMLTASIAAAEVPGLCNTGQTPATPAGCTGELATPNPPGGGPNRDGNWGVGYRPLSDEHNPCLLRAFVSAWVDTPNGDWLPNSASPDSEWITRYDGEGNIPSGWYVYVTKFPVPATLRSGIVPARVIINGRLSSDNSTYALYVESPANSGACTIVRGLPIPINSDVDWSQWVDFSFTHPVYAGADAYLFVVVQNEYNSGLSNGDSPTGLRVEFLSTSAFQ